LAQNRFGIFDPQKLAKPLKKSQKIAKICAIDSSRRAVFDSAKKTEVQHPITLPKKKANYVAGTSQMTRGRPPKKRSRNISGLRHQRRHDSSSASESDDLCFDNSKRKSLTPATTCNDADTESDDDLLTWDMRRSRADNEEEIMDQEPGSDSEVEEAGDCEEFGDEEFEERMIELAIRDDPKDTDWLPSAMLKAHRRNKGEY
jgi:hypothetical protein